MISIVQQPLEVTPIYNDIVMTVVSDKIITKFKNKYVFDIFGSKQKLLSGLSPSTIKEEWITETFMNFLFERLKYFATKMGYSNLLLTFTKI